MAAPKGNKNAKGSHKSTGSFKNAHRKAMGGGRAYANRIKRLEKVWKHVTTR